MCTAAQTSHATRPLKCQPPTLPTARERPIVARLPLEVAADRAGGRAPLLHGDGTQAGQHLAILLQVRHVADDEHLRVPRDREIALHGDPSVAVEWPREHR